MSSKARMARFNIADGDLIGPTGGAITTASTVVKPKTDYDAIIGQLLLGMRYSQPWALGLNYPRDVYLKEFCTIGFLVARQSGASTWCLKKFVESSDDTILVFINDDHRRCAISNASVTIGRTLTAAEKGRMYSVLTVYLHALDPLRSVQIPDFNNVILDGASHMFDKKFRAEFYTWLGTRPMTDPVIFAIS